MRKYSRVNLYECPLCKSRPTKCSFCMIKGILRIKDDLAVTAITPMITMVDSADLAG